MAHRISVSSLSERAAAARILATLRDRHPKARLKEVEVSAAYVIDASLSRAALDKALAVLVNPAIERGSASKVLGPTAFSYALHLGFRPGVTDNVGNTARQMIEDALGKKLKEGQGVYSSKYVFLTGALSRAEAETLALELHNSLIERASVIPFKEWKGGRVPLVVPKVRLAPPGKPSLVNLEVSDEELRKLGKEGVPNKDGSRRGPLALSVAELHAIREHFRKEKRRPTDIELESLAQTWSEHCKHTIFSDPMDEVEEGIYRRYIKGATNLIRLKRGKKDFCVSVFKDNSGAIAFDEEYLVTHKMETHNTPSALDPYGGAITGIVGVNRDALGFGLGAKPVANLYGFCVGEPSDARPLYRDKEKTRRLLSPRRILEGVVKGIEAGGNQSGIPTPLGFVYADESYRGKPLVFAGTVGLIPRRSKGRDLAKKKARAGDLIVMIGGRVGADGIHGATFSSEALAAESPATAVQIGDAITQKKFSDALVRELRDKALYSSMTDNGAGGLSCSVAEMAQECGGAEVDLEKVPLKYPGLALWQIWISESQERMTLSVPRGSWKELSRILRKHGTEATVIGRFTSSGRCVVKHRGKTVMSLPLSFLHDGRPQKRLSVRKPKRRAKRMPARHPSPEKVLLALLGSPNVGSYAFVSEQYDHEVQGQSVTKPLQGAGRVNADAGVFRPRKEGKKAVVLAHGYAPSYSALDPYKMAAASIDTAVRNAIAAGAPLDHLAILDNFCWSSSDSPERLWQLREAARACYDVAVAYGTPYISGKDSMYNDFRGFDASGKPLHVAVMPTLLISAIGVMKDFRTAMTIDLKSPGDAVYQIGRVREEFGGSEYAKLAAGTFDAGTVPATDAAANKKAYAAVARAIGKRLVSSAIAVSRGGLGAAAAKMALAGNLGMELSTVGHAPSVLFSESQGRFLVTVPQEKEAAFKAAMKGAVLRRLGTVTKERRLRARVGRTKLDLPLSSLSRAYHSPYKRFSV